jgi:hypothetical protein
VNLVADCGRCAGLCCVAPAFSASADFAIDKPAGRACPHLSTDSRCGIHDRLAERGFPGCVAYDCFGAGQRTVALLGPVRTARTLRVYEVLHQLHELLFYLGDALDRPAAAPVHPALVVERDAISGLTDPAVLDRVDPAGHRAAVAPLLRRASAFVRSSTAAGPDHRGADLVGRDLSGADLRRADLSTAYLLGAELRGADLREADLLGADLRGADLRGADLTGALYLTRTQIGAARGDTTTALPATIDRPAHWTGPRPSAT